jgi:hypothetical protein
MATQTVLERRAGFRVIADLAARIHRDGHATSYRVIELSCTGARLCRTGGAELPMVCTIELDLDETAPLRMMARTVWSEGALSGIRFVDACDADRLEIAERIDELVGAVS